MTWELLLPIIIRDGLPAAMRLWQLIGSNEEVTQAKWDELITLSQKTYADYIREAKERAGQAPEQP